MSHLPPDAAKKILAAKIDDGGPAFPTVMVHWNGTMIDRGPGMSLRDHFAGLAMQGDAANSESGYWDPGVSYEGLVIRAKLYYRIADAMLAARKAGAS